jgi:hypothetical protein
MVCAVDRAGTEGGTKKVYMDVPDSVRAPGSLLLRLLAGSVAGVLAGAIVLALCHQGAGLESDTLSYIIYPASGEVGDLPVHHGILYPLALRIAVLSGWSIAGAMVAVNVVSAMATAFLMVYLLSSTAWYGSVVVALSLSLFTVLSLPFLVAHAYAMSEPVFLCLAVAGILLLGVGLSSPRHRFLYASAVVFSVLCLARYAGVAFVGAGFLSILLFSDGALRQRVLRAITFGVIGGLPLLAVLVVNRIVSGTMANRTLSFRPVPRDSLQEGAFNIASVVIPERILVAMPWLAAVVALGMVALLLGIMFGPVLRKGSVCRRVRQEAMCGMFAGCYLLFLMVCIAFVDVSIMLSYRMLSPLILLLPVVVFGLLRRAPKHSAWQVLAIGVIAYLGMFTLYRGVRYVHATYNEGSGYASAAWNNSPLVDLVERLSRHAPVYSNAADALSLRGRGGRVIGIPSRWVSTSGHASSSFADERDAMISRLVDDCGLLAVIHLRYWPPYLIRVEDVVHDAGLTLVFSTEDGAVYAHNSEACLERWRRIADMDGTP